jgi:hypothetical protein
MNLARRSAIPVTLTLNRRRRDPGPSSIAGLAPRLSGRVDMLGRSCTGLSAPRAGRGLREED